MSPFSFLRPRRRSRPAPIVRRPGQLRLEALEGREVPATLIGLTASNTLVAFDSATPNTLLTSPVTVTGLSVGESLVGIDYRPANGVLYGIGSSSRVYTVDAATGVASPVGPVFPTPLAGGVFGVNFNPVVDRIRITSDAGQNLVINPDTGAQTVTTNLTFDPADPNNQGFYGTTGEAINPPPQGAVGSYTLNFDATLGTNVTTLYSIDPSQDILFRIGGPDGTPGPNNGLSAVIDEIRTPAFTLIDFGANPAFDIQANTDAAFAVNGNALYTINLATATATAVGTVAGQPLKALAVAPPAAGAGTLQLSAATIAFPPDRSPIAITVNRTGGATDTVMVNYATADGSAVAGTDYLPSSGTLTFGPGVLTQTIFLLVPAGDRPASPEKTFSVTLSSPTNGAVLGATTAATVTIPAVVVTTVPPTTVPPTTVTPTTVTPTRFYAAGSGAGGQVAVYAVNGGVPVASFAAFGGGFAGAAVVAVGDLNADGFDDLIVGAGSGGGPRVTVYDGQALAAGNLVAMADFFAFGQGFTGGVSVAAGDVNGDGYADLIIGAGTGGGPRVIALDGKALSAGTQNIVRDFFAFQPTFFGGVNVASGELTGDGFDDIVIGAQAGGGPRVVVFDGNNLNLVASFFAFGQGFTGGVNVGVGDLDGDGRDDLLTGAGSGGGPRVLVFDGRSLAGSPSATASFFAYEPTFLGGVKVGAADVTGDGSADPITGPGLTGGARLRVFGGQSVISGNLAPLADLFPFGPALLGGLNVG